MNTINTLTSTGPSTGPSTGTESQITCDEEARAQVLAAYGLDALHDDPELSEIVRFASRLCKVPVSTVTVVERERQLFLSRVGIEDRETPRSTSFCAAAMLGDAPLIVTDASKDPRFAEFIVVTGAMHLRFYAGVPLKTEDGTPIGALCVIDTVPHPHGLDQLQLDGLQILAKAVVRRLQHNLIQTEATSQNEQNRARLRAVINSVPQIAWSADSMGNFDYFNARWQQVTGGEWPRQADDWIAFIHPDDFPRVLGNWREKFASGEPFESEYRLRLADGKYHWVLARALPTPGIGKETVRWYGTITDIDSSHRETEASELLAGELSHRIKNIFAVIASLVALTSRQKPEVREFAEELTGKIRALGRANDFVRPLDNDKGDSLHGLLEVLLKPYAEQSEGRLSVSGENVPIGARAATPLALVFHEFATNAAKYGALSVPEGKIAVCVTSQGDHAVIEWQETGGPAPADDGHKGFGSRLVEMAVTSQLRGELVREMRPEGFGARLKLPLSALL